MAHSCFVLSLMCSTDWLSFLTSLQMLLTLLAGFAMLTDKNETYDSGTMDQILVVVNSVSFVVLFFSIVALHPKVRICMNKYCGGGGEDGDKSNTTKVVPLTDGELGTSTGRSKEVESSKSVKSWGREGHTNNNKAEKSKAWEEF